MKSAELRMVELVRSERLPFLLGKLKARAGYSINVDLDWNSFLELNGECVISHLDLVFDDIDEAIKRISADQNLKACLPKVFTKIEIINSRLDDVLKIELDNSSLKIVVSLAYLSLDSQMGMVLAKFIESQIKHYLV